jgi:SAM-dependent methyltransferase
MTCKHLVPIWTPLHLHRRALYLAVRGSILARLPEHAAKIGRNLDVLDAGCGSMPYESLFARTGVCNAYHGADVTPGPKVSIRIDPAAQRIEADDESYDVVVHFQVLEHVPRPEKLLEECYRVLRQGGQMICTIPFLFEYHAVPGDYHRWTDEGICTDLGRAGFSDISIAPVETQLESIVTLGSLIVARWAGYFWTKPAFGIANLIVRALPIGMNRIFTLTYLCSASK